MPALRVPHAGALLVRSCASPSPAPTAVAVREVFVFLHVGSIGLSDASPEDQRLLFVTTCKGFLDTFINKVASPFSYATSLTLAHMVD